MPCEPTNSPLSDSADSTEEEMPDALEIFGLGILTFIISKFSKMY